MDTFLNLKFPITRDECNISYNKIISNPSHNTKQKIVIRALL